MGNQQTVQWLVTSKVKLNALFWKYKIIINQTSCIIIIYIVTNIYMQHERKIKEQCVNKAWHGNHTICDKWDK